MNKKTMNKNIALIIAAAISIGQIPVSALADDEPVNIGLEMIANEEAAYTYEQSYNEHDTNSWTRLKGNGTIRENFDFVDEANNVNGVLEIKRDASGDNKLIFVEDQSPVVKDFEAEVRFMLQPTESEAAGRFGLVFRGTSAESHAFVGYNDNGKWLVETAKAWKDDINGPTLTANQWVTMKVTVRGSHLTLVVNGEEIFADNISLAGYPTEAGKFGYRTWYDNKDVKVDYLKIKSLDNEDKEVESIDPISIETLTNKMPELPYKITATYTDGSTGEHVVEWGYIDPESYAKPGTFTVEGTLKGVTEGAPKAIANITVRDKVIYETDFETEETSGDWKVLKSTGTPSVANGTVTVPMNSVSVSADMASPSIKNFTYETDFKVNSNDGRIGLGFRIKDKDNWGALCYDSGNWVWKAMNNGSESYGSFSGAKKLEKDVNYRMKLIVEDNNMQLYIDGELIGQGSTDKLPQFPGKVGLVGWFGNKNVTLDNVRVEELTGDTGTELPEEEIRSIESSVMKVNIDTTFPRVVDYTWKADNTKLDGQVDRYNQIEIDGKRYVPQVICEVVENVATYTMTIEEIGVVITSTITVDNNKLRLEITKIEENGSVKVKKINLFNNSLATVRSDEGGSMAGVLSTGAWHEITDEIKTVEELDPGVKNKSYGFLNNNDFAVTINNNTVEYSNRVTFTTKTRNGYKTTGIGTSPWTYREVIGGSTEFYDDAQNLWTEIIIAKDNNEDGTIDWQDAAIEYRNNMEVPMGGEDIKNSVSHVAFNIGYTQNPFLRTLDTIKKIYNYTDGFGQMVLHKGYQGEGHDDVIPDYGGHIGIRQGGVEDFNTLVDEALKYDAKLGVHINATEYQKDAFTYPQNGSVNENAPGWGWLDQAYYVDQRADLTSGELFKRLDMLKQDAPNLGWVYVDVYSGNGWNAHQLGEKLNDLGFGVGTEFHSPLEEHVIWNHWGADPAYPNKGGTSEILRFIANSHRDGFLPDELLKGNQHLKSGGWGTDHSIEGDGGIATFYNQTLPTKYMQHFEIMKMEENKITFNEGLVAVKEGTDYNYYKDGKLVATTPESSLNDRKIGKTKLFLPWNPITEDDKIYHWNPFGTSSEWELPESWGNLSTVEVYEITDLGRTKVDTVNVTGGKVTLNVKQNTPYIVTKGEVTEERIAEWGTGSEIKDPGFDSQGWSVWNKSSESETTDHITFVNETASRRRGNDIVSIADEQGKLSQEISGLKPGVTYSVSAWVKNDAKREVELGVKLGDKTVTNVINDSAFVRSGEGVKWYGDNFVRLEVEFTVPENVTTAEIYLDAKAGSGTVLVDDFRIWDHPGHTNKDGYVFYEDFENVDEGITPLFLASGRGFSNRTHLAEKDLYERQKMSWVLDGRFSLKTNQQPDETGEMIVTDVSTLQLKPNTKYEIGFLYSLYDAAPGYTVNVKSKSGGSAVTINLEATGGANAETVKAKVVTREFTTGNKSDYYLSIDKGNGYRELILDNMYIKEVKEDADATLEYVNLNTSVSNDLPVGVGADFSVNALMNNGAKVDLSNATVEYEVSNDGVISIENGKITGLADGATNVTAKVTVDGKTVSSNTVKVSVGEGGEVDPPVLDSAAINLKADGTVKEGESTDIKLSIDEIAEHQTVQSIDATFTYDSTKFELGENAITAIDGSKTFVKYEESTTETVRVIITSLGAPVVSGTDIVNIKLTAKDSLGSSDITMAATYSDGNEIKDLKSKTIQIDVVEKADPVNKGDLETLVNESLSLVEDKYTTDSWKLFTGALKNAQDVLANENATQEEVNLALNQLQSAKDGLVEKEEISEVFKKHLEIAVEVAQGITDFKDVVPAVKAEFDEALAEAVALLANAEATQDQINKSFDRLSKVIQMLEFKGDRIQFLALVDKIKALDESKFTASSWNELQEVLNSKDIQEIINNENALQADINKAYNVLLDAYNKLEVAPQVNKDKLNSLIAQVENLNSSEYIEATWNKVVTALEAARKVSANAEATQEKVDEAYENLLKAYLELRLKPSKDKLEELINKAESLDANKYTDKSYKSVEKALKAAKKVFADDNATAEEIAKAEKNLEVAMANLEVKNEGTGQGSGNSNNNGGGKGDGNLPATGGTPAAAVGLLGTITTILGTVLFKRRRK